MTKPSKLKRMNKNRKRRRIKSSTIKVGTWYVRTLLAAGRLAEMAKDVERYNIDITALQVLRWGGEGRIDRKKR